MSISDSYFIWLWSLIARILNFDAIQIYLLLTVVTGIATYLVTYQCFKSQKMSSLNTRILSIFTIFYLLPTSTMGRPSPTQTTIWMVLLCILKISSLVSKPSKKNLVLTILLIVCLFLFNGIYATYIAVFATLVFLNFKDFRNTYLKYLLPVFLVGTIFTIISKLSDEAGMNDLRSRLGFLNTHLPGALKLTVAATTIGLFTYKYHKDNEHLKVLALSLLALPIAANQNVITGKWWEPEAHLWCLMIILISLAIFSNIDTAVNRDKLISPKLNKILINGIILLCFLGIFRSVIAVQAIKNYTQQGVVENNKNFKIIEKIKEVSQENQVLLQKQNPKNWKLPAETLLLTDIKFYWDPMASLYEVKTKELLKRYACTLPRGEFSKQDFFEQSRQIYVYQFLNPEMYLKKWNKVHNFIGIPANFLSEEDKVLNNAYNFIISYNELSCRKQKFEYKIDWILEKNGDLVIAYMLVDERYENIHYIDLFDTVVRNNNLGYHMINKYEKERDYNVNLIPQNIILSSAKYWAKILPVIDDSGIVRKNLIDDFMYNTNIKPQDIAWECLYYLCDKDEESYNKELEELEDF